MVSGLCPRSISVWLSPTNAAIGLHRPNTFAQHQLTDNPDLSGIAHRPRWRITSPRPAPPGPRTRGRLSNGVGLSNRTPVGRDAHLDRLLPEIIGRAHDLVVARQAPTIDHVTQHAADAAFPRLVHRGHQPHRPERPEHQPQHAGPEVVAVPGPDLVPPTKPQQPKDHRPVKTPLARRAFLIHPRAVGCDVNHQWPVLARGHIHLRRTGIFLRPVRGVHVQHHAAPLGRQWPTAVDADGSSAPGQRILQASACTRKPLAPFATGV